MLQRTAGLWLWWGLIGAAHATEQIPDRIRIDGQNAVLLAEPLAPVLDDQATWQRFVAHARPALGSCSANWRGYQADWRVEQAQVLLDRIVIGACDTAPPALPLEVLFPGRTAPVAADWIHGELVVALPIATSTGGAAEAPYLLLQVQHGRVVTREPLSEAGLRALRAQANTPGPATTP
ncbi:hypothetical protein [Xanthomonas arboricola]|uniref:hypothetical protein n=1 Tax=Xanthomonas arboricola TaxID=56448 RepID=UPI000F8C712E|nr:hypothetical protein [Xanthomonas arboricola]CAE6832267.1 hypothetical protein XA1311A_36460 [Xanthomonas arboricola]CAE6832284.1 hypothetical protein XA1311A_36460 [Xanthomonas arboricola]